MKKLSARISKLSYLAAYFFSAVLFVSANSASSFIIYQETPPESLRLLDGVAAVQHFVVAHINADVGDRPRTVIGSCKKGNVPRLGLGGRNDGALVVNALRRGTGQVVDAACGINPADEAGAVKGSGRAGAAPHIGLPDILRGLGHQCRKGRVGQSLAGYLISGFRVAASRVNPFPQIGLVAFNPGLLAKNDAGTKKARNSRLFSRFQGKKGPSRRDVFE